MKILHLVALSILSIITLPVIAQSESPKGFQKGTLVLADGQSLSGLVKDNIRKSASVQFSSDENAKKKSYNGTDLVAAEISGTKYICINGDFFKVFCEGELSFLQKSSDASGKPVYNGTEAIFSSGTEGKPDDYFIYHTKDRQLKLVSGKNLAEVVKSSFGDCTAAIEKAKSINGDLTQLKVAVETYNNRTK